VAAIYCQLGKRSRYGAAAEPQSLPLRAEACAESCPNPHAPRSLICRHQVGAINLRDNRPPCEDVNLLTHIYYPICGQRPGKEQEIVMAWCRTGGEIAIAGFLLVLPTLAFAQGTPQQREACSPDAFRLCGAYMPDPDGVAACLRASGPRLSPACHDVFFPQQAGPPPQPGGPRKRYKPPPPPQDDED
jgi:hypothetical protein